MKIEIIKDKDVIYYNVDGKERNVLSFENLVVLSGNVIELNEKENFEYTVEAESDLLLYKETVEKVFKSILEDKELLNLLQQKKSDEEMNVIKEEDIVSEDLEEEDN